MQFGKRRSKPIIRGAAGYLSHSPAGSRHRGLFILQHAIPRSRGLRNTQTEATSCYLDQIIYSPGPRIFVTTHLGETK